MATSTKRRSADNKAPDAKASKSPKPVVTLAVDIGGTGTKTMLLDETGKPISERVRDETPRPATPDAIVDVIVKQAEQHGKFDRISVGFPGVVDEGVVHTAPNLDKSWEGFDLADALQKRLGRPTRVRNDADVQGFGAIQGKGVELVLTLGTGLGSALYVDGHLVPNLELAHHPFRKGKTYEECVGVAALKRNGRKRWNRDVARALDELRRAINFRACYIGGGNAKKLNGSLPANVSIVDNTAGLLGGISLWRDIKAVEA
jgi:polyphosphate glucokinase